MSCAAEDNSKKQLEKIRNQQLKAQQLLGQLDRKSHFLEALTTRAKQTPLAPEQEVRSSRKVIPFASEKFSTYYPFLES